MSYSLERNAHKSEADQLSATLIKEKNDREKANTMVSSFSLFSRSHCLSLPALHWRQPGRGCRGHIPPQYFGWGNVNGNFPPILLRTFGYSRPILVAQTLPTEPPKGVRCGEGCSLPTPHPIRWFVPPTLNSR